MTTESSIEKTIQDFANRLPKFSDGRIDYSLSDTAPVLTCFVRYREKILLLKRGEQVATYKGKWMVVAGYLDEVKPVRAKVLEELREELSIEESMIEVIHFGQPYTFTDKVNGKTWIIHPVMADLNAKPEIELDWEHTDFRWISPSELSTFDTVPNLAESLKRVEM